MYPVRSMQLSLMLRSIQVALKSGKGDVMEREREYMLSIKFEMSSLPLDILLTSYINVLLCMLRTVLSLTFK